MKILLPNLFQGHAPITLQNAFHDALEAIEAWRAGEDEPLVAVENAMVPISNVLARMSDCTDEMPRRTRVLIEIIAGSTPASTPAGPLFSDGVSLVMPLCVECLAMAARPVGGPAFDAAELSCVAAGG